MVMGTGALLNAMLRLSSFLLSKLTMQTPIAIHPQVDGIF
jgi:hypothetical protein